MSQITNPNPFKVWVASLQRSVKPGEIFEVAEDLVHDLIQTGVFHLHDDAPAESPAQSEVPAPKQEVAESQAPASEAPEAEAPTS
jgi:hypothetical protein